MKSDYCHCRFFQTAHAAAELSNVNIIALFLFVYFVKRWPSVQCVFYSFVWWNINVNCYCSFNSWRDSYRQPSKWDRDAIPGRSTRTSPFVIDASYESIWWKQCTNCKTLWKSWSPLPVYAQISREDVMLTFLIQQSVIVSLIEIRVKFKWILDSVCCVITAAWQCKLL